MKVLFVSSGNSKNFDIIPFIKVQGDSLKERGVELKYFTIKGKGLKGYLNNVPGLYKYIKQNNFDIIHAHYSLTAFAATLAIFFYKKPLIVSLMGSDAESGFVERFFIKSFNFLFWDKVIVKAKTMAEKLNLKNAIVLPNGVNTKVFYPAKRGEAIKELGLPKDKQYIVFAADPDRNEKNYELAKRSVDLLRNDNVKLLTVFNVAHKKIAQYLNAASVLLLTSKYEGSPNIVKEAMATGCPVVSTDVGDVRWVMGDIEGCYLAKNNATDVSGKIITALQFAATKGRTKGSTRIKELGLDSVSIAEKLIGIYKSVLDENG